jgi:hypothetical protein
MPVPLRRHVAFPSEHGTWAFLLGPLLIGLFAGGRWTLVTTYLVVAALCAFLVRQPITRAIKAWAGRGSRAEVPSALAWTAIWGGLGALHLVGLVLRGYAYVLWLAVPGVPVYAVYLALVWHRAERRQWLVEVLGAGVMALVAPAAYWVGLGRPDPVGWVLFALAWGHTTFGIALAYVRLDQRRWSTDPGPREGLRRARAPLGLAGAQLAVVVPLAATGGLPPLLFLPYLAQGAFALHDAVVPAVGWMPRRIGLRLLGQTALFVTLFVVTWA